MPCGLGDSRVTRGQAATGDSRGERSAVGALPPEAWPGRHCRATRGFCCFGLVRGSVGRVSPPTPCFLPSPRPVSTQPLPRWDFSRCPRALGEGHVFVWRDPLTHSKVFGPLEGSRALPSRACRAPCEGDRDARDMGRGREGPRWALSGGRIVDSKLSRPKRSLAVTDGVTFMLEASAQPTRPPPAARSG